MRKFYAILLAMLCLSTVAVAQTESPARVQETIEGTTLWGYYRGENLDDKTVIKAVAMQEASCDLSLAVFMPGYGGLNGATIHAVNVPINKKSELSNFEIVFWDTDMETVLYSQKVPTTNFTDWALNTVRLDEPFTITQDMYVGMRFHGTSVNGGASVEAILVVKNAKQENSFWYKESTKWWDMSMTYGALPIQLQVSGAKSGALAAYFNSISGYTAPSSRCVYNLTVNSDSEVEVTDIDYTITVDGKSESYTVEVPIAAGPNQKNQVEVMFHSPATPGEYTVDLTIDKVNGQDNTLKDNVTRSTLNNLSRRAERRTVMEEYTGTWCGYCPQGIAGIKTLNQYYPDNFIAIAYHYGDPMDVVATPGATSDFPNSMLDRNGEYINPFYGTSYKTSPTCEGIVADFDVCQEKLALTDVTLEANWADNDHKKVNITADIEALTDGNYTIYYALTADSLYREKSTWVQHNFLYKYTKDQWYGNDFYGMFCKDGEYGQEEFLIPFDEVCIANSCKEAGENEVENLGQTLEMKMGDKQQVEYTLTMPTSSDLLTAIKASITKVNAVVVVLNADGTVSNAARVRIPGLEGDAIHTATADQGEAVRYTLDGRRASASARGPIIVRQNGTSRIVIQ